MIVNTNRVTYFYTILRLWQPKYYMLIFVNKIVKCYIMFLLYSVLKPSVLTNKNFAISNKLVVIALINFGDSFESNSFDNDVQRN